MLIIKISGAKVVVFLHICNNNNKKTLQKVSASTQFTYKRIYYFARYDVLQNVGEEDVRYRFVITKDE